MLIFCYYIFIFVGYNKTIIKVFTHSMTILESQIFIALFIALGNGFLAFLLGNALYQR